MHLLLLRLFILPQHSKHVKSDHYRPTNETPSEWRFAGWPIVARDGMLAGVCMCRITCLTLNTETTGVGLVGDTKK